MLGGAADRSGPPVKLAPLPVARGESRGSPNARPAWPDRRGRKLTMAGRIADIGEILRMVGPSGFRRLLRHSGHLQRHTGSFLIQHALFALDQCGLAERPLSPEG